jgi:hypothetical protein
MDYHWQQFELRRLKGSSEDFQRLFEDIMVRASQTRIYASSPIWKVMATESVTGLFQARWNIFPGLLT